MRIIFLVILLFCTACHKRDPVVIIGGGPAGLATAIEAMQSGAAVTVVEKRSAYTRRQFVILLESSLQLLDKWKVALPEMKVEISETGERLGIVDLAYLEERLYARIKELGITRIEAECIDIQPHNAIVAMQGKNVAIAYDVIVAADGCHSKVRQALGIPIEIYGKAQAALCRIPVDVQDAIDETKVLYRDGFFVRKIATPIASIICAQSTVATHFPLEKLAKECGWEQEAVLLHEGKALIRNDIEVLLQQAKTFSDAQKRAIVVGDAAACASFLQGMGANTAFSAAAHAGTFFANRDYAAFDKAMKKTTDALIDDSRYLFP